MSEMKIRVWAKGNPGNIAMIYLTAMTLQNQVGRGEICNVGLPIFGIDIPDVNLSGKVGIHDNESTNRRERGRVPF